MLKINNDPIIIIIIMFEQGWSLFSVSATKLASKATESACKIGEMASNKVADLSLTVSEKVSE